MFPPSPLATGVLLWLGLSLGVVAHPTSSTPSTGAALAAGALTPGSSVPDFRLVDHLGVSHALSYEATAKAVVIVFTGTNTPRALQTATALRALRARFSATDVVVWQIDSTAATRKAILAEQTLYNNDLPVLIDEAQIVATEFGATRVNETFIVGPAPFRALVYRGPLDDSDPAGVSPAGQNLAADAVAALLAGKSPASALVDVPAATPLLDLPPAPATNYTNDIAPIVLRRCVSCHSTGNIAPHVYASHSDLANRSVQIRSTLLTQEMAPWHADSGFGAFSNGLALTPAEASALELWAKAGAPRGSGVDPLTTATAPPGGDWPLGPPDLIVSIPKQDIPAQGTVDYRYLTVSVPVAVDRWLRAAVVRPGNSTVVHHALVFEGTLLDVLLNSGGLGGYFAGYVPGLQQNYFPTGTGKLLKKNSSVTFQMHYVTTGSATTDQSQIGFYFASTAPDRELLTKAASTTSLTIPPGAKDYEREASFVPSTTKDVTLFELNPHMHYRGKRVKFEAQYPNGTTEVLLNVPHYDFDWQTQYRLSEPKRLPAGTTIRVSGAFDNSAQNPANPDATATVRFGEQTTDEMFIGYINYAELPTRASLAPPYFSSTATARGRVGEAFTTTVTAANSPSSYRASGLPAGLAIDASTGTISGTPSTAGRYAATVTADNAAGSATTSVDLAVSAAAAPVFTTQPRSVRALAGENVTLSATVSAGPAATYAWYFRGALLRATATPALTLTNVSAANAGDYYVVATNSLGSASSAVATLTLGFNGLVNLSARANVGTGSDIVIPGITIAGDKPKTLLIRAVGPTLGAFGVAGTLANPTLSVFDSANQKVAVNDNWGDLPNPLAMQTAADAQSAFGLGSGSRDSAALVTLAPGRYTVQVAGTGTGTAAQGVALVEVYEADASPSTLVNLSCRARVGTGGDVLIAGFAISGTQPRRLLIRGVGPTLSAFGISGALADPKLDVFVQGASTPLISNDNWSSTLTPTFESVSAFGLPNGSKDAALVVTLAPGSYTAQVSGVGNTTGVAIIEVYDLP